MEIVVKKAVHLMLITAVVLLALPVWSADKASDEQTLRNASAVLEAMLSSKDVPASIVANADCVIVLPSVKKFAVGIGGTGGRGPMSCRGGKNFSGEWSAPDFRSAAQLPISSFLLWRRRRWTKYWTARSRLVAMRPRPRVQEPPRRVRWVVLTF